MDFSDEQIERYSRQLILNEIGGVGQEKLKNSNILVIGAGGLGSAFLLYAVAAGIGRIGIVEFDRVDMSNLARQILYRTDEIGQKKLDIAEKELTRLNPEVKIDPIDTRLKEDKASEIFSPYNLIVDCTDNFESRFIINRIAIESNKPLISGAVVRFEGNIMLVIPHKTFCYNCVFEKPSDDQMQITCSNSGVFGSVVGTIATIMCTEAIKFIVGTATCAGNLLIYDGIKSELRKIPINRNNRCPTCSNE